MKGNFFLVLDNIRSAKNTGVILRSAEGAGVNRIFLCGITADKTDPKLVKTALESEKYLKIEYSKNTLDTIIRLKKDGFQIISLEETEKTTDYRNINYKFPVCLVVGNEVSGVSDEILEISDFIAKIPMRGKKNSLNVSAASSIAMYHILNIKYDI